MQLKKNELLKITFYAVLALAIFSGNAGVQRFLPSFEFDIQLKYIFLAASIFLSFFLERSSERSYPGIFKYFLGFLISLWLYVLISGLMRQDYATDDIIFEILFIIISVMLVYLHVSSKDEMERFVSIIIGVGFVILLVSQLLRMGAGVNILTNITSSRILIVSLACAFFKSMNLRDKYYFWAYFPLPVLGYEFISNSLKMNLISTSFVVVLCALFYFIIGRYFRVVSFLALFFAGVLFGVALNADSNLRSRVVAFQQGATIEGLTASTPGAVIVAAKEKGPAFDITQLIKVPEVRYPDLESLEYYQLAKEKCDEVSINIYCPSRVLILFGKYKVLDVTERLRFWAHSIDLFFKNPVFGVGRGGYKIQLFYNGDGNPRVIEYHYPHNVMFEYLSMYGFVGYFLMIVTLIVSGFIYLKATIRDKSKFGFIVLYLALLMASMMGGTLFDIRYIYVFAAMLTPSLSPRWDRNQVIGDR